MNDLQWQAILSRDAHHDNTFFYGVLSTRIFCRPSCPSRRPRREGARVFITCEDARNAGFRACKRCQPEREQSAKLDLVARVCDVLNAHETPPSLSELSCEVGFSPAHLQRTFQAQTGVSPREYSDARRLQRFKSELGAGASVLNAQLEAGYSSTRSVYERAETHLGMTPATYGKGGVAARIGFVTAPCVLGVVLVAATPRGVCSVTLGDNAEQLETQLRAEFFAAEITRDDASLQNALNAVLRYLEDRAPSLQLPLDVRATAFQWRVWRELQTIARGQTRSYAQIATQLGQPTASRAVASACARNPVALVVPCHRVVRGNGELSGYRWGVARKRALLQNEQKTAQEEQS